MRPSMRQVGSSRSGAQDSRRDPGSADAPLPLPTLSFALNPSAAARTGMGPSPPQPSTVAPYTQPGVTTVNHPSAAGTLWLRGK